MSIVNASILNLPFKALSDPIRREITLLLKDRELTAGEICENFDITESAICYHLYVLKQSLLVTNERKEHHIYYSLNTTVLKEVTNWFLNTTLKQ